jgi:hypothetical protein
VNKHKLSIYGNREIIIDYPIILVKVEEKIVLNIKLKEFYNSIIKNLFCSFI